VSLTNFPEPRLPSGGRQPGCQAGWFLQSHTAAAAGSRGSNVACPWFVVKSSGPSVTDCCCCQYCCFKQQVGVLPAWGGCKRVVGQHYEGGPTVAKLRELFFCSRNGGPSKSCLRIPVKCHLAEWDRGRGMCSKALQVLHAHSEHPRHRNQPSHPASQPLPAMS